MFECCKQAYATTSAELDVGNDDMGDLYPVLPSYEVGLLACYYNLNTKAAMVLEGSGSYSMSYGVSCITARSRKTS